MADDDEKERIFKKLKRKYRERQEWKETELGQQFEEAKKKDPLRRLRSPIRRGIDLVIDESERERTKESLEKAKQRAEKAGPRMTKIAQRWMPKTFRVFAGKNAEKKVLDLREREREAKEQEKEARMSEKEKQKLERKELRVQERGEKRERRREFFRQKKEALAKSTVGQIAREVAKETKIGIFEPLRYKKKRQERRDVLKELAELGKEKPEEIITCKFCGGTNLASAKYCGKCGVKVLTEKEEQELEKRLSEYAEQKAKEEIKKVLGE